MVMEILSSIIKKDEVVDYSLIECRYRQYSVEKSYVG